MTQSLEERQQICRNDKQFSLETEFLREYSSEEPDMTDMGYVVYKRCVDAETPVLTGDLKWVPAGELDKGDEIIGFDEEPVDTGRSSQRYFRAGEVTSNHIEPAETMGIELEDGRTLYATPDHEWLVKFDSSKTEVQWRETQDLESTKKGSDVYLQEHFGKPWSSEQTYEEGYIAGAYDGEGNLDKLSGLNFTQVDNAMKQKMEDILSDENIEYTQTVKNASQENPNRQDCFDMRFHGFTDIARLLGRTQPERLVEKFMKNLRHGNTQSDYGQRLRCDPENLVKVENVFDAGERDIAMLSTDVSTHFTGGFASHNTYARRLGNGETEEWWQTVKRVVEGVYTVQKRHYDTQGLDWNEDEKRTEARQMYEKIFNFKFTPPGRGLWAMGTDYIFDRETSAPLFNCAFVSTENIQDDFTQPFCYMMDMSMLGVGVGFDTRGKGEMTIKEPEETDETYVVPDSREGWVESVRTLLEGYAYGDEIPGEFDYSEIRDEGEPLEGFGGTSSGAGPLTQLHENIHKLLSPVVGEEIDAPTIVDLMNLIGKCVVAGNIRRSAQICIGEPHNEDYLSLKDPDEQTDFWGEDENEHHRWAANLSVNAEVGMDYSAPAERTAKNGEPGYIWLENGRDNARMGHNDMPEDGEVLGTNPCAEILLAHGEKCVSADTRIQTRSGAPEIEDVVGDQVEVWNGDEWSEVTPRKTREDEELVRVHLSDGSYIDCTPDHRFIARHPTERKMRDRHAEDLMEGDVLPDFSLPETEGSGRDDAYMLGFFGGDGCVDDKGKDTRTIIEVGDEKYDSVEGEFEVRKWSGPYEAQGDQDRYRAYVDLDEDLAYRLRDYDTGLPDEVFELDRESALEFIAGFIDSDGSVQKNPETHSYRVYGTEETMRDLQILCRRAGIDDATVRLMEEEGAETNKGTRSHSIYYLSIPTYESEQIPTRHTKATKFGSDTRPNPAYEDSDPISLRPNQKVVEVERLDGEHDTFCFDEPEEGKGVFGNTLTRQCNLSETYPSNHDNLEEWQETLRFAYVYAKTVTLLPNHNDLTDRQIRDKRRLGVSISGIIQAFNKHGRRKMLNEMEAGYEYLQELDEAVSDMWNVCESIRLTSVKPSGTVSRLADVTSGIHYPEAPHYTRNIRFNENSDVLDQLREAGYPTEPDKYSDNSTVVSFPMKKENIEKAKYDVSMWEQLENAAQVAEHWADNAVSITVTYDPETEADDIEDALELYEHRLKTVSFLPAEKGVYDQAPYIPISEGEFKQNKEETGELDLSGDTSEKIEKFCQGDKCEIDLSQVDDE